MKIAIVGKYPLDTNKISGGVANVNYNLVEGLRKLNNLEIHVITCGSEVKKAQTVFNESIKIHYLPGQKRFGSITLDVLDRYWIRRKIKEIKPDIIHSHDQGKYTYTALRTNYPTVVTISTIALEVQLESKYF